MPIQRSWRFNPQLTTDAKFCEYLESNIKIYFETNDKNDTSPTLLWEAFKAYLRGCIISFQSSLKKRNKAIQLELEGAGVISFNYYKRRTLRSDVFGNRNRKIQTL